MCPRLFFLKIPLQVKYLSPPEDRVTSIRKSLCWRQISLNDQIKLGKNFCIIRSCQSIDGFLILTVLFLSGTSFKELLYIQYNTALTESVLLRPMSQNAFIALLHYTQLHNYQIKLPANSCRAALKQKLLWKAPYKVSDRGAKYDLD